MAAHSYQFRRMHCEAFSQETKNERNPPSNHQTAKPPNAVSVCPMRAAGPCACSGCTVTSPVLISTTTVSPSRTCSFPPYPPKSTTRPPTLHDAWLQRCREVHRRAERGHRDEWDKYRTLNMFERKMVCTLSFDIEEQPRLGAL
jgi:hypothetical protein